MIVFTSMTEGKKIFDKGLRVDKALMVQYCNILQTFKISYRAIINYQYTIKII